MLNLIPFLILAATLPQTADHPEPPVEFEGIECGSAGEWLEQLQDLPPVQEPEEDRVKPDGWTPGKYTGTHGDAAHGYASCPYGTFCK